MNFDFIFTIHCASTENPVYTVFLSFFICIFSDTLKHFECFISLSVHLTRKRVMGS